MDLTELEAEADVFSWELAEEAAEVEAAELPELAPVALRNAALEALDALEEFTAPDETPLAETIEALNLEVESAEPEVVIEAPPADEVPEDVAPVQEPEISETVEGTEYSEAEYAAESLALFNEKFPGGIADIFPEGFSMKAFYGLCWSAGIVSGQEEWTEEDFMVADAILMTLENEGQDVDQMFADFEAELVETLFDQGFSADELDTIFDGLGPISGEAEWTQLDYMAVDLASQAVLQDEETAEGNDVFAEAFPDGIATLFPEGYSDAAFDEIAWGNGLVSGEAEWTEEDHAAFNGLWNALEAQGIEPYSGELEAMPIVIDDDIAFPLPIVIEDEFVYPQPIVIDDGFVGEADFCPLPIVVEDSGMRPMEPMPMPMPIICPFPPEDMRVI